MIPAAPFCLAILSIASEPARSPWDVREARNSSCDLREVVLTYRSRAGIDRTTIVFDGKGRGTFEFIPRP
jgi:hypothetical protein